MAIVFKTPKSTLNTTSRTIQNLGSDCPPCPEPELQSVEIEYDRNGEYTVTPDEGYDGLSQVEITVDIPSDVNNQNKSVTISSNGESTISADSGYSGLGEVTVTVDVDPVLARTTITPTTSLQTIEAPQGYDGFEAVNVLGVDSSIDSNILSNNIKNGITILGVTGSYTAQPNLQSKSVNPSTSAQTVSPDGGYDGLSQVSVSAVTSAIDANITAGNIKDGVTILGVQGTYTGGTNCPDWSTIGWNCSDVTSSGLADDVAYTASIINTPSAWKNNNNLVFAPNSAEDGDSLFQNCFNLKYVPDFVVTGTNNASYGSMFSNCVKLARVGNISAPNRLSGNYSYSGANIFSGCTELVRVGTIDFNNCKYLTSTFFNCPNLTTIGGIINTSQATSTTNMFSNCKKLATAPLFDTSNVTNMSGMFANCDVLASIPQYDTSSVTDMQNMFNNTPFGDSPMTTAPSFNTSNVTNMRNMFGTNMATSVGTLVTVPLYDCTKVIDVSQMFTKQSNLTNLAGFTNLGKSFYLGGPNTLDLSDSSVLTKQSIMNVINNLAAPDNTSVTNATLVLSATSYALLDASDIAIATAKNWTVTSA